MDEQIRQLQDLIQSLNTKVETLESKYANHRHTGTDGSFKTIGDTDLYGSTLTLGAKPTTLAPLVILGNEILKSGQRGCKSSAVLIYAAGTVDAQINAYTTSGRFTPDATTTDYATTRLIYNPNYTDRGFFTGECSPLYANEPGKTVSITHGGSTLTDSLKKFTPSPAYTDLVGAILTITSNAGAIESHIIASNTATVITITGTWASTTGDYTYSLAYPVYLGQALVPWRRGYFSDSKAIRLGLGASSGTDVIWISYGAGSPEGFIYANPGSIYLRTDGGAGTSFYVKESNTMLLTTCTGIQDLSASTITVNNTASFVVPGIIRFTGSDNISQYIYVAAAGSPTTFTGCVGGHGNSANNGSVSQVNGWVGK